MTDVLYHPLKNRKKNCVVWNTFHISHDLEYTTYFWVISAFLCTVDHSMSGITLCTEGLPNPSFALDLVAYSSPPKMLNLGFSLSYCWKLYTTLLVELLLWNKVCFLLTALKFTFSPLSLKFSWFVSGGFLSWSVERLLRGLWSAEEGARIFWSVALFWGLDPEFISLISCLGFGFVLQCFSFYIQILHSI